MKHFIKEYISDSIETKERIMNNDALIEKIFTAAEMIAGALKSGHKLLIAGNGGSAADAQHIAAEFVCRFYFDRPALPAVALSVDTSVLTATIRSIKCICPRLLCMAKRQMVRPILPNMTSRTI